MEGYAQVNLAGYAGKLQSTLLHGRGDETVNYAFTLQFDAVLIGAGKQFSYVDIPQPSSWDQQKPLTTVILILPQRG